MLFWEIRIQFGAKKYSALSSLYLCRAKRVPDTSTEALGMVRGRKHHILLCFHTRPSYVKAEIKIRLKKKMILGKWSWGSKEYRGPVHTWQIYVTSFHCSVIILVGICHPHSFIYWCTLIWFQGIPHNQLCEIFSCANIRKWGGPCHGGSMPIIVNCSPVTLQNEGPNSAIASRNASHST